MSGRGGGGGGGGVGGGIGRVYAEALFQIAKEKGTVDAVSADLAQTRTQLRENPKFQTLFESPELSREETERMVREAFGSAVGETVLNLLLLLVRKRRQPAFARIVEAYEALCSAQRNERRAAISTATPLDDATRARIADTLSKQLGARVVLDEKVDPALLGGALLRVGDTLVDGTLRTSLARLARHMSNPIQEKGAA